MNTPWSVIDELAATDSKLEKQAIIAREAAASNTELFEGFKLTFDPMVTFGVKKIEAKPELRAGEAKPKGLSHQAFADLCDKLATRKLTGDAAQVAIGYARNQATTEQWDGWYRRILIKDLKGGFGDSTINTVCEKKYPQYSIMKFEVQLAKDCAGDDTLLVGQKLIDCKLDGMRCMTIVYPDGTVNQYSRNGKELFNFGVIKAQIAKTAIFFAEPVVLDGEVMGSSFQDLMKQAKRKSNVAADDSVLHLFDIITLKEFQAGIGQHRQIDRSFSLAAWHKANEQHLLNVEVVGNELVDLDTDAGQARLMEINKAALIGKYEGIMIKDPAAVYECKRSLNWMKMKPFIEESLTVVDVEEGKPDSKFVGSMGALVCQDYVGDKLVRVNVGGGYSIQQRAQIWANFTGKPATWEQKLKGKWVTHTELPDGTDVIGMVAEVRADAITKSEGKDTYGMRFPRFKTWRGFEKGEKL